MRHPLLSCSRVVIMGTLIKTYSVQEGPTPCPDPWAGSGEVF